ncbi:hypothetical protein FOA43_001937 [Brettanomyces nanus]|uniref:Zinc/iron permease n=1 Tax=Eeniella nana TaxID=13502 RepID=A0A875S2N5_EENNA|nr:uncharacterized protein FOA43_001937 [Brettanomyces nanus]QPG74605.1 hypothetical protein FOA43_001937 [Brettanomyces nanus]
MDVTGVLVSAAQVLIIPEGISHSPDDSPIGLYLLAGFITLFTIDRFSDIAKISKYSTIETDTLDFDRDFTPPPSPADLTCLGSNSIIISPSTLLKSIFHGDWNDLKTPIKNGFLSAFHNTDTLGLLIHCLTDGIALASSLMASSESSSFQSIFIVLAIFLHKLPTAFALVSILLENNLPKLHVVCHLIAFSLAAPIGAIITYLIIVTFVNQSLQGLSGLLLTFSGGSFLYVGFHALQNISASKGQASSTKSDLIDYTVCIAGMLLPVLVACIPDE